MHELVILLTELEAELSIEDDLFQLIMESFKPRNPETPVPLINNNHHCDSLRLSYGMLVAREVNIIHF